MQTLEALRQGRGQLWMSSRLLPWAPQVAVYEALGRFALGEYCSALLAFLHRLAVLILVGGLQALCCGCIASSPTLRSRLGLWTWTFLSVVCVLRVHSMQLACTLPAPMRCGFLTTSLLRASVFFNRVACHHLELRGALPVLSTAASSCVLLALLTQEA